MADWSGFHIFLAMQWFDILALISSSLSCICSPGKELLIIFEQEAEQWASYMRSVLSGSVPEAGICCYNIAMVSNRRDNFLELNGYKCKLLILSRGMLEGMCQLRRFFLSHVLRPEVCVVVLLCGVESLEPLLELIPLRGEECLQISSEQDAQEYHSAVIDIICRGESFTSREGGRGERNWWKEWVLNGLNS